MKSIKKLAISVVVLFSMAAGSVFAQENTLQNVVTQDVTQSVAPVEQTTIVANAPRDYSQDISVGQSLLDFIGTMGILNMTWQVLVMLIIACILIYLAIVKGFEPLLLLPIAFGMLLTNLPGANMFHSELFADGHVHWGEFTNGAGLLDYLYLGVKLGIYPCLIFVGIGAMTDFGPLIANPKSLLLGAAAQVGIFITFIGAILLGFLPNEAGSIGIIGGADGPTAIFLTSKLAPHLLGPIAVAAYSYMALVPVIQPPIMRALTTQNERCIKMKQLRIVSKKEKILFPIIITAIVSLILPDATSLIGCLMFGNLLKECGVAERLSKTVQNELLNIVTIFLGTTVGATATAATFLSPQTIYIIVLGVIAFSCGTAGGVLLAKFMNLFSKDKINPLIGSAGVSAVPMAARVSQTVGQQYDSSNYLLMHAMGPNVAGVIGSAVAAGLLLSFLG
ncbi:oxaloacetate decarboxylase subunit beta [Bacteroidia bacterium]|nr:oxaloacetate decarboxylase subunit beta [Bacteroidia bacterium]